MIFGRFFFFLQPAFGHGRLYFFFCFKGQGWVPADWTTPYLLSKMFWCKNTICLMMMHKVLMMQFGSFDTNY